MRRKTVVAAVSVLLFLVLLSACATETVPDYGGLRGRAWEAELCGVRDGSDFSCKVSVTPIGENCVVCVEYLTPDTLCGVSVAATCDGDGALHGDAEIKRGETQLRGNAIDFYGLLEPAVCWLSLKDHASVQKEGGHYVFGFADGVSLTLDGGGTPKAYSSPHLRLETVWLGHKDG